MRMGDLNCRIDILTLENAQNIYTWDVFDTIWAKAENLDKTNLFSKVGIGVKSAKFTVRKCELTLHQAIRWRGRHYFLTDITEIDHRYYEVIAAQIEPKTCMASRNSTSKNELNRPVNAPQIIATFPGCLIEKYLGYQQQKPQAINELTYVLVTPKAIELRVADLVKIGDDTFNVQIVHSLDEYKNEYEINLVKDVS